MEALATSFAQLVPRSRGYSGRKDEHSILCDGLGPGKDAGPLDDFDSYLSLTRQQGTWLGSLEIGAFSVSMQKSILVLSHTGQVWFWEHDILNPLPCTTTSRLDTTSNFNGGGPASVALSDFDTDAGSEAAQSNKRAADIEGAKPSKRARSITYSEFSRKGAASTASNASRRESSKPTGRPRKPDTVDKTASNKEQLTVGNLKKYSAARAKASAISKAPAPPDKPEQAEPERYGGIKWEHNPTAHAAAAKRHTPAGSPRVTARVGDVLLWDCDRCRKRIFAVNSLALGYDRLAHITNHHKGISASEFSGTRSLTYWPKLVPPTAGVLAWRCAQCKHGFLQGDGSRKGVFKASAAHLKQCPGAAKTPWLNYLRLCAEQAQQDVSIFPPTEAAEAFAQKCADATATDAAVHMVEMIPWPCSVTLTSKKPHSEFVPSILGLSTVRPSLAQAVGGVPYPEVR